MIFSDHQDDLGQFAQVTGASHLIQSRVVKTASWEEKAEMHDRDFALILVDSEGKEHRKYAMHDAGNTALSVYYFLNNTPNIGEAGLKLAAANLAESIMYKFPNYQESPEFHKLAAISQGVNAEKGVIDERRAVYTPIREPELAPEPEPTNIFDMIKEASLNWASVDIFSKRQAALQLTSMADSVGASVPEKIAQYTGDALSPNFEMLMSHRTHRTANEEVQEGYRRLSKLAHAMQPSQVIEAVFLLDEQAGLLNKYASDLPDPVLCVYATPTKVASDWSWNYGGDHVNESQLARYATSVTSHDILEKLFGSQFRDSFRRDPKAVFEKMPREQQSILARLATQSRDSNHGGN